MWYMGVMVGQVSGTCGDDGTGVRYLGVMVEQVSGTYG